MDGLVPDVMHGILEGSLQYEVKELLKYFIHTEKYLTLDELNKKITEFPYVLSTKPATTAPTVPIIQLNKKVCTYILSLYTHCDDMYL